MRYEMIWYTRDAAAAAERSDAITLWNDDIAAFQTKMVRATIIAADDYITGLQKRCFSHECCLAAAAAIGGHYATIRFSTLSSAAAIIFIILHIFY